MRHNIKLLAMLLLSLLLGACAIDNMEAPYCHIQGRMIYDGVTLGVKGTAATVSLELWQAGFGKESAQTVNVAQDGTFSTYVYPGVCRIITKKGVGPWEMADTLRITVKGSVEVDYEVTPYATLTDVDYSVDGTKLTATMNVHKLKEDTKISAIGVLVNNTQFVDLSYTKKGASVSEREGLVTLEVDVASLESEKALFARCYVKINGVDEALYSPTPFRIR